MNFDYKDFFKRLREKVAADDILGNSAQVAFYFTFALFPLLLFLMTLLGIILQDKQDLQNQLYQMLGEVMPGAAFELVRKTLEEVTAHATGGKLALGVLTTLWAASAGIDNMRGTLNEVYDLKETRGWFKAKLTSLLLTPRKAPPLTSPFPLRSLSMSGLIWLIEMAKPMFCASPAMAVFMPTTSPSASTSGPPEFPWLMAASVWMRSWR